MKVLTTMNRSRSDIDPWINGWIETHGDKLAALAYNYLQDRELAQDAVQEAVFRLYQWKRSHREDVTVRWLYTVTRHVALDMLRRHRRDAKEAPEPEALTEEPDLSQRLAVQRALDRMSQTDREALWLFYYEDWSIHQIAATLKISENAVAIRLNRARARFARIWTEGGSVPEISQD